jgi:hypothetical protein
VRSVAGNPNAATGTKEVMILAAVVLLSTAILTMTNLGYPYILAKATSMTNVHHIDATHNTHCDGDTCQAVTCINDNCQSLSAQLDQPYNQPLTSNQPYNQPLTSNQPYNQPLTSNQPYNQPLTSNQPYNQPYNQPLTSNQPYNQPYNQPLTSNQPDQTSNQLSLGSTTCYLPCLPSR